MSSEVAGCPVVRAVRRTLLIMAYAVAVIATAAAFMVAVFEAPGPVIAFWLLYKVAGFLWRALETVDEPWEDPGPDGLGSGGWC